MPAATFFVLLEEGYRRQYRDYRMQANIVTVPHMENADRKRFLHEIDSIATDPRDIFNLEQADDYSNLKRLKNLLR